MPKARRSSYTMAFRIKVLAEAKAVENSSEAAWDYGLSESMVRRWRRNQATILSGKLKMPARLPVNFPARHVKSAAVTEFTVISHEH